MFFQVLFCTTFCISLYAFWVLTQKYLSTDTSAKKNIIDRLHDSYYVSIINRYLLDNINAARFHIALTTFLIDANVVGVFAMCIFGYDTGMYDRIKPIFLILTGIVLRQICQFINRLPKPKGIVWFDPGVPTFLMEYSVSDDFFFSGHTLISLITGVAIYQFNESYIWKMYAIIFSIYEIGFIIVSKAHYFMDVYAAITTFFTLNYIFDNLINYL